MATIYVVNIVALWVIVLINLLLTFALVRRINTLTNPSGLEYTSETLPAGSQAPYFIAETLSGEKATVADYAQKETVLVFVSPTCGHCRPHIPVLEKLQPKAKKQGVELVLVSDSALQDTQAYARELNISLPILAAPRETNAFLNDYKIAGVPMYTIIDGNGMIKYGGHVGDELWERTIAEW